MEIYTVCYATRKALVIQVRRKTRRSRGGEGGREKSRRTCRVWSMSCKLSRNSNCKMNDREVIAFKRLQNPQSASPTRSFHVWKYTIQLLNPSNYVLLIHSLCLIKVVKKKAKTITAQYSTKIFHIGEGKRF